MNGFATCGGHIKLDHFKLVKLAVYRSVCDNNKVFNEKNLLPVNNTEA